MAQVQQKESIATNYKPVEAGGDQRRTGYW